MRRPWLAEPPIHIKDLGRPKMVTDFEISSAAPRATIIMPSVTINGGMRPLAREKTADGAAKQAQAHAAADACDDRQGLGHALRGQRLHHHAGGHARKGRHAAHRQVYAAGKDNEHFADGDNADDRASLHDVPEVLQVAELGGIAGESNAHAGQNKQGRVLGDKAPHPRPRTLFLWQRKP